MRQRFDKVQGLWAESHGNFCFLVGFAACSCFFHPFVVAGQLNVCSAVLAEQLQREDGSRRHICTGRRQSKISWRWVGQQAADYQNTFIDIFRELHLSARLFRVRPQNHEMQSTAQCLATSWLACSAPHVSMPVADRATNVPWNWKRCETEGKKRKEVKCDETIKDLFHWQKAGPQRDSKYALFILIPSSIWCVPKLLFSIQIWFFFLFLVAVSIVSLAQLSLVTSAGDLQKGPLCRLHRATVPRQWINWIDFSYVLSCVLGETTKQPCFFLNRRSKHLNFWLHWMHGIREGIPTKTTL